MADLTNPFANGLNDPNSQQSVFGGTSTASSGSSSGGLGIGFNPVQAGLGLFEAVKGAQGLKNLEGQPMPTYSLAPQLSDYYNKVSANQGGFNAAQKGEFAQNVAQQQNTGYKQGIEMGG